jgi:hypothetical protein
MAGDIDGIDADAGNLGIWVKDGGRISARFIVRGWKSYVYLREWGYIFWLYEAVRVLVFNRNVINLRGVGKWFYRIHTEPSH